MERTGEPTRIAILKPCCLGDCVMALPAVDAFLIAYPGATVDIYVGRHSRAAFEYRSELSIHPIPDIQSARSALELSRRLRQERYDIVACLDRSRWLRLAARTSLARQIAAVRQTRSELRHEAEIYLDAVRSLNIPTPIGQPEIIPTDPARQEADQHLRDAAGPTAVLHPGGAQNPGTTMLGKRWPISRWVELARLLSADGLKILLSGSASERALCLSIAQAAGLPASDVIAGQVDLAGLAAVLERSALYVGPDTGVSHIAAATGTPTVAIFGPTNPRRYRPLGPRVSIVAPAESWFVPDRDLRRESNASGPSTNEVAVEAVVQTCRDMLAGTQKRRRQ